MHSTQLVKSTQPSVPSPDGKYLATLNGTRLEIRHTSTLTVTRAIDLSPNTQARFVCLRWGPITKGAGASTRFLLSDEDTTRVWDLEDDQWSAVIDNGSGGMGKVSNVEFGSDDTEVLVFSSFGAKVTVWSLWTGRSVEIKDPKFAARGYGRNRLGRTGTFALLTRPGPQDVINFHVAGSNELLKSFTLPTVDAQGLKWSPDGKWLAVWDTARTGYKVLIFTADGNLFRTYHGDYFDDALIGLGIKSIEWCPMAGSLIVGGYEQTLSILTTRTFSPAVYLSHANSIRLSSGQVFQEQATPSGRSYTLASQPMSPPSAPQTPGDNTPKIGVSILKFNSNGSFLATKEDSMPTCAWIWDLEKMTCRAVLVQHAVIKKLAWHPTDPNKLLIHCIQGETIVYVWDARDDQPRVYEMPAHQFSGKVEAHWIPKSRGKASIMVGDANGFALAYPDGKDEPEMSFDSSAEESNDEHSMAGESEDSLYEILSGNKGAPDVQVDELEYQTESDMDTVNNGVLDDTFQYRKGVGVY